MSVEVLTKLLNNRHLYGCSVEKMILESTLVLVLLVSGELGREDHYYCTLRSLNRHTHNTTHCGVVVMIYRVSNFQPRLKVIGLLPVTPIPHYNTHNITIVGN